MFNESYEAVPQKGTYGPIDMEALKCLMNKMFTSAVIGAVTDAGVCSIPPLYQASVDFAPTAAVKIKQMRKPVLSGRRRVRRRRGDASKGGSPYWEYANNAPSDGDGIRKEDRRANPDVLPESSAFFHGGLSDAQLIFGEAVEHLQGQQKRVYLLLMRYQKSEYEAAEMLGISRDSVKTYKERAIKFITAYCQEAIAKGRV